MEKRLFLLDAYALIFRAYYALIKMPRITSSGFNTSAIFGFVNTLEEILNKEHPSHIAVCFDPPGPTFRKEMFENYKGERQSTPEDIVQSIPVIKSILNAYRIPVIEVAGYEADDVIGTMSRRAEKEGFVTYMMTPDKDFGQLVTERVFQYKPAYRGGEFELRGEKEICEKYDISHPSQIIDLLALMGDSIDSIPGCPGIGEVRAVKLIKEFGSVQGLLNNTESLKGAIKKNVEENVDLIKLSYDLATIRTDVPVEVEMESLRVQSPDKEALFEEFRKLEFRALQTRVEKRLNKEGVPSAARAYQSSGVKDSSPGSLQGSLFDFDDNGEEKEPVWTMPQEDSGGNYKEITGVEQLDALQRKILESGVCGMSIIASGEADAEAKLRGIAFSTSAGEAVFISAEFKEGIAAALDIAANKDICKVTMQAKRDYVVLEGVRHDATEALQNFYDIGIAHYLLQPDMRHDLLTISESMLNIRLLSYPESDSLLRACREADMSLRLYSPMRENIAGENLAGIMEELELPLTPVLARMEIAGVKIDSKALEEAAGELTGKLNALETEIHALAGEDFNISSPMKVGEILFDKLQLMEKAKKTRGGKYSTSEEVLEKLVGKHPIVGKILEYRQLKKLLNTYLLALPTYINPATGRIHTNYNQTVAATGRLSSSNPNLQNIPVRDEAGRNIRKAFIADQGCLFLSADYSQIELRLVADFAEEESMLEAFQTGRDIHALTASRIYHKPLESVSSDERRHAKTANFGILYGITAFGLASRLNIPRSEAKDLIDNYFSTFPKLRKYISDSVEHVRENGYTVTASGRKRRLPDINSKNPVVRGYAERNAINAPIQGTAADIIKRAMIDIDKAMRERGLKTRMIMQVHDELNFEVPQEELAEVQELVSRLMQEAYHGRVTLTAECGVADNWLDAH